MKFARKHQNLRGIERFLIAELLFILVVPLIILITLNANQAISALLGGLVALLPTLLFTRQLFAYQGAKAAKRIIRGFYQGEALKIISAVGLFILVFVFYEVQPLSFFLMYIAVVMFHWFAPWVIDHRLKRPKK